MKICNGKTKYYNKEFNLKITMIKKKIEDLLNNLQTNEVFYCYCGGKALWEFEGKNKIIQKIDQILEK